MSIRCRLLMLATLLGASISASAEEALELRMVDAPGLAGGRFLAAKGGPRAQDARFHFGPVSNLGPAPRRGRRVTLPDGSAHFVTSVTFEVVRAEPEMLRSPRAAKRASARGELDGLFLRGTRDLWAVLHAPTPEDTSIRIAPAGTDWSAGPMAGTGLEATEVLVRSHVVRGDVIDLEVSLWAHPTASGTRQATVAFELR